MIRRCFRPFTGAIACLVADSALAGQYHLPEPQSIIARQIYDLHALITWAIVLIFIVVFGAMTCAIIRHRKSAGRQAEPFHENITVEIVWAVIPLLILIGTAYPAIKTVIAMSDSPSPEVKIKAAADQSKWGYDYAQEGIGFCSELAAPRGRVGNRAPTGRHYLLESARATSGATRRAILSNQPGPPLWS